MMKPGLIAACLAPVAGIGSFAGPPPSAPISNGLISARICLPDRTLGCYRGTRFDWSGVIQGLQYAGHEFYGTWFQRVDPKVHDFIYDGAEIVAGPCTAITGPAEEFSTRGQALGFEQAKPGGTFIKIGVGILRKPDDSKYDMFHLYELVDPGQWTIRTLPDAVEFTQDLFDPSSGNGYEYHKKVALTHGAPQLVLKHSLKNTGKQRIETSVYNHNFLYVDGQPPGVGYSISVPYAIRGRGAGENSLVEIQGNRIQFRKKLAGEDRVFVPIDGFGSSASDYDFRIENKEAEVGVRITADRPLSRAVLWCIRAPLSVEPFIEMSIDPGQEFTWRIQYDYYTLKGKN